MTIPHSTLQPCQLKSAKLCWLSMLTQMDKESCAVCWRDLSSTVKPTLLPCGHTYCSECSESLRTCPLCRRKIPANYRMPTNYSLLSLIEKNEAQQQPETKVQETQTEDNHPTQQVPASANQILSQPVTRRTKAASKQGIRFKFSRSGTGVLEGMEISIV